MNRNFLLLATIAALMLSAAGLSAQTFGQITGQVSDTSGAVVPNATITLTNAATSATRRTVTTGAGDYTFVEVPPGVYNIQAEHSGFKTSTTRSVQLSLQQTLRLDFRLSVGETTQVVNVSATGTLLQTSNGSLGTVIENQAITQLPLNGRNYLGLVALTSNANTLSPASGQAGSRLGGDRSSQSISVGGQRIQYDYYTLDGVDNTDPDFGTYIAFPSIDAIQEFKVQTGVYSAQFGHQVSQITVVTKSGTNSFHGSGFEFLRNDTVDALPYNFSTTPLTSVPFHWNDYGFTIGGPVWIPKVLDLRNRLFFVVNDEWLNSTTRGQGTATLPTQAELNGDFSAFPATIYDPLTGVNGSGKTQISCNGAPNVICPDRIDPVSKRILQEFYNPASVNVATLNYPYTTNTLFKRRSSTVRTDFNQSARLQWAFRWSHGNEPNTSSGFPAAGGTVGSKTITHYNQFMGSNTWTITPTLVNQATYGYTSFYNSLGTLSQGTDDDVAKTGIPGLQPGASSTWGIPNINFAGPNDPWSSIGDANDGPYVTNDPVWQLEDNLMWVRGKHTLHIGFEYQHQTYNELGNQFSRGVFDFQNNATANFEPNAVGKVVAVGGSALADFLLGDLYSSTYAVSVADANFVRSAEAAYAEDTYKIRTNLTLSLGLRYELTPPWYDTLGNLFMVSMANSPLYPTIPDEPQSEWPYFIRDSNCADPYQGINVRWVTSNGSPASPAPQCNNGQLPNALLETDYNNWAPRLGLSYSPTRRMVVRVGFGIFYNSPIANSIFDVARNLAGRVDDTNAVQGVPNVFWSNAVGGGGSLAKIPPPYGYTWQYDHRTPRTFMFPVDIQQQVGQNWLFEASYMGSLSRNLYGMRDANQPIPYGYVGNGSFQTMTALSPYPNYGFIQLVEDTGIGNYNAFSFKVTRRFSQGFSLISSYTYSKAMDDTSGIRTQQSLLFPQNSLCLVCDYSLSDFNVTNRFTAAAVYNLPVGQGRRWAPSNLFVNGVIGGWQLSTIATLQSGAPETIQTGFNNSNIALGGYSVDRPNAVAGVSVNASTQTLQNWLNPAAFAVAAPGTFGDLGRNSYVGPGVVNFDVAIHKDFRIPRTENQRLELRAEGFNAFNHPNWDNPFSNLNVKPLFGRILGTSTSMRELQFSVKYIF